VHHLKPLAITYRKLASITPANRNPRTHSPAQVEQIARSITAFGWTNPILVDERGAIIAGHGRAAAAQKLGMAQVPTITLAGLTPEQKRALVIADNQLAISGSGWDAELLALELGELGAADFDLSLIGFSDDELDAMLHGAADGAGIGNGAGSLAAAFGIPPFSVLNAREGWWQDRKAAWIALGIQSELGRGDQPNTSARVGRDDEATYRPIGGRKPNAIPGGAPMPLDRAKPSQAKPQQPQGIR
jgi:hypothetical protein